MRRSGRGAALCRWAGSWVIAVDLLHLLRAAIIPCAACNSRWRLLPNRLPPPQLLHACLGHAAGRDDGWIRRNGRSSTSCSASCASSTSRPRSATPRPRRISASRSRPCRPRPTTWRRRSWCRSRRWRTCRAGCRSSSATATDATGGRRLPGRAVRRRAAAAARRGMAPMAQGPIPQQYHAARRRSRAGSPWGRPAGGGFLAGAMQTALGVAGGVLIADALTSAFDSGTAEAGELAQDAGLVDEPVRRADRPWRSPPTTMAAWAATASRSSPRPADSRAGLAYNAPARLRGGEPEAWTRPASC